MTDPQPQGTSYAPSNSTNATLIGGSIAAIVVWILSTKGIFVPAGLEAEIGALAGALLGYLPQSGRR